MASARQDHVEATPVLLPSVSSERCVHALAPFASCRACVDACPRSAWILDDEGLNLDIDSCDGCGLCAPACPQDAVEFQFSLRPIMRLGTGSPTAFAACDRVVGPEEPGRVPCLHAIGLRDLARLYVQGARRLVASCGACATCPRDTTARLDRALNDLRVLLTDRGLPDMEYVELEPSVWRRTRDEAGRMSRRGFFRALAPPGDRATELDADGCDTAPPFPILPSEEMARIVPVVPRIDAASCRACNACLEMCPTNVIERKGEEGGELRYEINAVRCTGCGLCVDACDVDAICLTLWADRNPPCVRLVLGQCEACGNAYYETLKSKSDINRCHICATSAHRQNLFQVLP